jgi:broad specificity phosphatase PhoE
MAVLAGVPCCYKMGEPRSQEQFNYRGAIVTLNLFLLRHGETTYSQSGAHCGWIDPELTADGLEMANQFAQAYRGKEWQGIYCSPMKRTIATAQPLSFLLEYPPEIRISLKEIHYGEWEGKTLKEVRAKYEDSYQRWQREPAWNAPDGGETGLQVANRAMGVVSEITNMHKSGNILIVSHKATIRIILCNLLGIEQSRYRDRLDVPACSVSIITMSNNGPMLKTLGDRHHLDDRLRNLPGT